MNITSVEAGKKLGIGKATIVKLGNEGKIMRIKIGKGEKKPHYLYDTKSLNEFKKTEEYYKVRKLSHSHSNGTTPKPRGPYKKRQTEKLLPIPQESVATGIKTRLGNLEDEVTSVKNDMTELVKKVNHLIQIWS